LFLVNPEKSLSNLHSLTALSRGGFSLDSLQHMESNNDNGRLLAAGQLVTCRLDELHPHPSYIRHHLTVSAAQLSALAERGDQAFLEPLVITQDRTILDGYARLELARLQGRGTLPCIEYELTESEALHWLLQKHRRSNGLNAFSRILLALDLEAGFKEKARSNQQAGGQHKGSSKLTEAERLDVRREIAAAAGVCVGNVSKVKRVISTAHAELLQALSSGEVSIHWASLWWKESAARQREELRSYQSERGIKKTIRRLVSRHRRKGPPALPAGEIVQWRPLEPKPPGIGQRLKGAREVPRGRSREAILGKLRHAVAFQIGLWDTASEIAEMVNTELGWVLEWINATSIVADSGLELGATDLEDFLGGGKGLYKVGKRLSEYPFQ
jgi:hypothetical protein